MRLETGFSVKQSLLQSIMTSYHAHLSGLQKALLTLEAAPPNRKYHSGTVGIMNPPYNDLVGAIALSISHSAEAIQRLNDSAAQLRIDDAVTEIGSLSLFGVVQNRGAGHSKAMTYFVVSEDLPQAQPHELRLVDGYYLLEPRLDFAAGLLRALTVDGRSYQLLGNNNQNLAEYRGRRTNEIIRNGLGHEWKIMWIM